MAEAAWAMIEEERRSTLPWPFGPRLDEKELELRRRRELATELLAGRDPRSVLDRYEAARKRRISSTGRRLKFLFEMEGGTKCTRYVIEDVKQIHKGMANNAAAQNCEEKLAVNVHAPAIAVPTDHQSTEEKQASDSHA